MKLLLDPVLALLRDKFSRQEVATLQAYGGEFTPAEIDEVAYTCPAIFITVLGWQPGQPGGSLAGPGVRNLRLAAFIAFKHVKRELRMEGAMAIADKLCLVLKDWTPERLLPADYPLEVAALESEPSADNLYSRATDKKGQAVWMVDWMQAVRPLADPGVLANWLVADITNLVRTAEAVAPPDAPLPPELVGKPSVFDGIVFP